MNRYEKDTDNRKPSREQYYKNKNSQNKEDKLEIYQIDSYLNIWDKIPSFKDINTNLGIIKIIASLGIHIMIGYLTFLWTTSIGIAILVPTIFFLFFIFIFGDNIFLISSFSGLTRTKFDPFANLRFWFADSETEEAQLTASTTFNEQFFDKVSLYNRDILYFSNTQDLQHCGLSLYKISVLPENVSPNLNHFIKSLHIAVVPFTYQVIQAPLLQKNSGTMSINLYFAISYYATGILTKSVVSRIKDKLRGYQAKFEEIVIEDFAHTKIEKLVGDDLVQGIRNFVCGMHFEESENLKDKDLAVKPFKTLLVISFILYFDVVLVLLPLKLYWIPIINIILVLMIFFIFWREIIFSISRFTLLKGGHFPIAPFQNIDFYRFRKYSEIVFAHINNKILLGMNFLNVKYATTQFMKKDQFIATPTKYFRALVGKKIPFTYTIISAPISYAYFEDKCFRWIKEDHRDLLNEKLKKYEQAGWMYMRNGFWNLILLQTVHTITYATNITQELIKNQGDKLRHRTKTIVSIFEGNFPNYELEHLSRSYLSSGIEATSLKSKFFRLGGTHLNYLIMQGKVLMNLMEISPEFRKAIETRIASEFNTPLNLENFITVGYTLNTEYLIEEVPAGFTFEQIKNLLITNGSYQARKYLLLKIVAELVKQGEQTIIFDYDGSFSMLLSYFQGTRYENEFLVFSLGKNFQIDPFDSDIPYDSERDKYISYVVDILAMVYKQRREPMDALKELLKEEKFSYTEFLLDIKNQNVWEKNIGMRPIISVLQQIREEPSVISTNNYEIGRTDEPSDGMGGSQIFSYEFIQNKQTIIIDLSIFQDLEPKVFITFVIIVKILLYMRRLYEEKSFNQKIFVIPNADIIFDNNFLDRQGDFRYGKIMKLLQPLQTLQMGIIMTANQIRDLHPQVFNYFNNLISFKTTDKRDIAVLKNLMNLSELHGEGYYSSKRKESYQVPFLMNLKSDELLVKRDDFPQPFPIIFDNEEFLKLNKVSQQQLNEYMFRQGYNLEDNEKKILSNAQKTLFEQHFKHYILFLDEIIKFFNILQNLDQVGNLYKSKIKEELLKTIYPKVQKRYGKDRRRIKLIRDQLFNIFLKYNYIIESHPRRASGSQSIRTSFAVGPQYQESLNDYFELKKDQETEISVELLQQESKQESNLETKFTSDNLSSNLATQKDANSDQGITKEFSAPRNHKTFNNASAPSYSQIEIVYKLFDHMSAFFMKIIDISVFVENQQFEKAVDLERSALPTFLVEFYCDLYPEEKNEMPDLLLEKGASFLLNSIPVTIDRASLDSLLEKSKLSSISQKNINQYKEEIRGYSDMLFIFFNSLFQDYKKIINQDKTKKRNNNALYEEGI